MSVISRHSWVEMSWEMYICGQSPRSSSLSAPFSHQLVFLLMTPQQLSQYSLWSCYSFSSFFSWFFSFFFLRLISPHDHHPPCNLASIHFEIIFLFLLLLMTITLLQRSQYSLWGRLHRGSGSMGLQSEWIGCDLAPKYGQHHSSDDDEKIKNANFAFAGLTAWQRVHLPHQFSGAKRWLLSHSHLID